MISNRIQAIVEFLLRIFWWAQIEDDFYLLLHKVEGVGKCLCYRQIVVGRKSA